MNVLLYIIVVNIFISMIFLLHAKKHLRKIELFVYWLFSAIPVQNAAALGINFSLVKLSDEKLLQWAYTINRSFLIPIIMVWFLNRYVAAKTKKFKLLIFSFFTVFLTGIDQLSLWIGLFENKYSVWWSIPLWFTILVSSLIFMKLFQAKLRSKTIEAAYDLE